MQLRQLSCGEPTHQALERTRRRMQASLARQTACMRCAAGATSALAPLMKVLQTRRSCFHARAHRNPTFGGVQELLEGNANPVLLFSRSCTQESYLLVHAGATGRREALWYGDSDCLTGQHGRVKGSGAASQVSSG